MGPAGVRGDEALLEFAAVMRRLRAECAWKRTQTHRSLVRYLLEEAAETAEAIETGTADQVCEELGDLLLQVFFHAVIAEESGDFTLDEVARTVTAKMVRRNPHVFATGAVDPGAALAPADVDELWQQVKDTERPGAPVTEGLPTALPALLYADKLIGRLARAGRPVVIDPTSTDPGERLLALAADLHADGIDAEQALREVCRRLGEDAA